jgi:hypothetical protein
MAARSPPFFARAQLSFAHSREAMQRNVKLSFIAVVATVLLMAGQSTVQAATPKKEKTQLQVQAFTGARLFTKPSSQSAALEDVPCGTILTEIRKFRQGDQFYQVIDANGIKGWADGYLLAPDLEPHFCVATIPNECIYGIPAYDGQTQACLIQAGVVLPTSAVAQLGNTPEAGSPAATTAQEAVAQPAAVAASVPSYTGGDSITGIICNAAALYGQSCDDMLRVATCESGLDPNNVTPPYDASGLFQFLPGTWASTPFGTQSVFDPVANANAAGWMWANGRRSEWVCQ